jgi:hypothetical protein
VPDDPIAWLHRYYETTPKPWPAAAARFRALPPTFMVRAWCCCAALGSSCTKMQTLPLLRRWLQSVQGHIACHDPRTLAGATQPLWGHTTCMTSVHTPTVRCSGVAGHPQAFTATCSETAGLSATTKNPPSLILPPASSPLLAATTTAAEQGHHSCQLQATASHALSHPHAGPSWRLRQATCILQPTLCLTPDWVLQPT